MSVDLRPETWTTSTNDALTISLVDENGAVKFKPAFTYPIYGDAEQVFGYKNLQIFLAFDSITMKPFLNVKYDEKLNTDIPDVQKALLAKLPKDDVILKDEAKWVDAFTKEQETFSLPDKDTIIDEYNIGDESFTVYKVSLQVDAVKRIHRRLQIFTLLFIEAASYIDESDTSWKVVITINKRTKQCIGYATTYQFWRYLGSETFDMSSVDDRKSRAKISQFLILPPYQGKGHGKYLYTAIFKHWLADQSIIEITVEDPNESFDDLRDRCDLERIINERLLSDCPNDLPLKQGWLDRKRLELKLEQRQFMRIVEMYLLFSKSSNYRLQLKSRIYEKNYEALMDMDESTKKDKLQTAYQSLTDDYKRILSKVNVSKRTKLSSTGSVPVKKIKT